MKSNEEKVREAREKLRAQLSETRERGRRKSPETIEKMRESAKRRWKKREEGRCLPNFLTLEEALELSREEEALYSCQLYGVEPETEQVEIYAIDRDGWWIMGYMERGLEDAMKRMEQMLKWEQTQYVAIRTLKREGERYPITAIGKAEWGGETKYVVGLFTQYTELERKEEEGVKSNRGG